ncbi:solute carrier family 45 member 3-like [Patiria miniata]|uniref:Solute carrier family 45 member 3 n=1 Tax=Patiria miniata TaxID=46514 RepID=A0A914BHN9_PATMI|nr:solute carrier family 45 member 3-like [Patiria miniata]
MKMATETHPAHSSYFYLVILNLYTFGIELCSSASFSYLPPLLLETGFSETMMSIVMALGPFFALIVLPCLGTASDQCTSRYGRRRPFILVVTICISISLVLLPNGMDLGLKLGNFLPGRFTGLAIISFSVILLDFGSQISLLPVELIMSDQCKSEVQLNKAYSVFNFMLSLGSCCGYVVLCIDWNKTDLFAVLGGKEHMIFAILLFLLLISALPTLLFAHDPPVTTRDLQPKISTQTPSTGNQAPTHPKQNGKTTGSVPTSLSNNSPRHDQIPPIVLSTNPPSISINVPTVVTLGMPISVSRRHLIVQIAYQFINIPITCVCTCIYFVVPKSYQTYLSDTVHSLRTMPSVLRKLCIVNLLTCMAVMGFKLYFTDYVGEALYHGNPDSPLNSLPRQSYENGIRMASLGLLLQSITSAMFSFVLNHLVISYGTISTFLFGMLSFVVMTALMLVVEDISLTLILAAFTGFASATTNSLPFTLLSSYHQNQEKYYSDTEIQDSRQRGIGVDMALLDSAYVLSEVLSSFLFGIAVEITGTTLSYMFCCCVCGLLGCYYVLQLKC